MNVQPSDAGDYTVDISNGEGDLVSTTTSTSATVNVVVPPVFVDQPDNTTVIQYGNAILSVAVDPATTDTDTFPLTYKWRKNGLAINDNVANGGDIFGTDTPLLNIVLANTNDLGTYSCLVTNYAGSALSTGAVFTVLVPPYIKSTSVSPSLTNAFGTNAVALIINVDSFSTSPLSYEWYSNNVVIGGATNATFSFIPNNTNQTATYYCVISNIVDDTVSQDFNLIIRPEITPPNSYIYTPSEAQDGLRWSNSVITLSGQAFDDSKYTYLGVALVQVQNNGGAWSTVNTANNWTNWSITLPLIPGSNTFYAQATDYSGNSSTSVPRNTRNVFYVVPSPFTLSVVGSGTVSSNWTGSNLEIGASYAMTATPTSGYKFLKWSGGVNSTAPALTFLMSSNLSITATFAETNRPTIAITNPASNSRLTNNSNVTISGTATDDVAIANIIWQINNGAWNTATGTTNWSAIATAINGSNYFRAYAIDTSSNFSTTNTLVFTNTAVGVVVVKTNGQGTILTNLDGQLLTLNQNYSMTAVANVANGFVFTNWTSSTNGIFAALSTSSNLTFAMKSNLTVQANFKDVQNPTVAIGAMPTGLVTSGSASVLGTAADNDRVAAVNFNLNGGAWALASGTNNWSAALSLISGTNILQAYSVDATGNKSSTNSTTNYIVIVVPPVLGMNFSNSQPQVKFPTVLGATYRLEYKPTVTNLLWNTLSNSAGGTGGQIIFTDTNAPALRGIYRVRITAP